MRGYRIVEHPSDVGFEAWGASYEDLVDASIAALAEIESGAAAPAGTEQRPVVLEGPPEERLVRILEQCLVLLDTEDWLAVGLTDGSLRGEPLSDEARAAGTHVKAVTWHHLKVAQDADGWRATVFVDL
jgi:SHS2 domain-containing protein